MATASGVAARNSDRKRVLVRGTLYTPHGAYPVWIRDISKSGTHVGSADHLPCHCDVIVKRGAMFAAGRIAWSDGSGAGVEFYRELTDDEVDAALHPVPTASN